MSDKQDFENLVDRATSNAALSTMHPMVEKELLHYEIFRALDAEGLLKTWCFKAERPYACAAEFGRGALLDDARRSRERDAIYSSPGR